MARKPRQIVLGARGADRGRGVAEHDKIGFAVERQFETPRRLPRSRTPATPGNAALAVIIAGRFGAVARIDPHERAERTMMADERVGDRADHPCRAGTERSSSSSSRKITRGLSFMP